MKNLFFFSLLLLTLWACNESQDANLLEQETISEIEHPPGETHVHEDHVETYITDANGNRVIAPQRAFEVVSETLTSRATTNNPHGLAAAIHSPYSSNAETHPSWAPPGHGVYWGGNWAVDLWRDNGNQNADYGWGTCNQNIYIDAKSIIFPGGQQAQSLKARLVSHGYACASRRYADGGLAQKWDIIATYNGVEYRIGWVLYAHLSNVMYPTVDTEVSLSSPAYIGKAFSGNIYGGCWGSCHIHMEFGNYQKASCFDIMPPTVNIDRVGIVGGLANTTTNCPPITSNLAENSVNCIRSSMYNSNFNCDKAHDGNLNTKWTSNGSSQQSSMAIDLGSVKSINKIVVKHAGAGGEPSYLNTQHFKIEYSNSSVWGPWTLAEEVYNTSQANESVIYQNFNARYVHLYVVDPGIDNYARIPELQVFGN